MSHLYQGQAMIKYTLKCESGHTFDSWFQSAEAFDGLRTSGHLSCAICGAADVSKAMMAPQVAAKRLTGEPESDVEKSVSALRKHVEDNSAYVGGSFAKEARAMHEGTAPERAIWGEAKPAEAKALLEDGVPVAPLPFIPRDKTN